MFCGAPGNETIKDQWSILGPLHGRHSRMQDYLQQHRMRKSETHDLFNDHNNTY